MYLQWFDMHTISAFRKRKAQFDSFAIKNMFENKHFATLTCLIHATSVMLHGLYKDCMIAFNLFY